MSTIGTTHHTPVRRTYLTGESLPALEQTMRPIPLGLDEAGEVDGQIRAFAVLIRNRSDSAVYIKEGRNFDEATIARGEEYKIFEPDGINNLLLRGETGDEQVEVRVIEAHNDFNIVNKIEGMIRSFSHFMGTATRDVEANITGSDIDIPISGNIDATITGSETDVPISGDVTAEIGGIGADVTMPVSGNIDATIAGSNVEVPVSGDVTTTITESQVTQDVDVSAQSVGDVDVMPRTGDNISRFLRDTSNCTDGSGAILTNDWTLYDMPGFDALITSFNVRIIAESSMNEPNVEHVAAVLQINRGNGWTDAIPREWYSAEMIYNHVPSSDSVHLNRYDEDSELTYSVEPSSPIAVSATDQVRFRIRPFNVAPTNVEGSDYTIELSVNITERIGAS